MFQKTTVIRSSDGLSKRLVVVLHGLGGNATRLAALVKEVQSWLPDADVLAPEYPAKPFSNADPSELAAELDCLIEEKVADRMTSTNSDRPSYYQSILLVGHSIGALIIRKAYVFGIGSTEDHPIPGSNAVQRRWIELVERVVLLAGMNRGWSITPRPKYMSRFRKATIWLGRWAARITGTGRLMRSVERGSPFVGNLRIQWIRLAFSPVPLPAVIQLLGSTDDIVSDEDHRDVSCSTNFIFVPVLGSGHNDLVEFTDDDRGRRLKAAVKQALTDRVHTLEAKFTVTASPRTFDEGRKRRSRAVFILHGIRDTGGWRNALRQVIESTDPLVDVQTPGYSYLPMLPFLFGSYRRRYVRMFVDRYTEVFARYPRIKVCCIGHSNGTYIIAKALRDYRALRIDRIVFAGSVVPRDYPFDQTIDVDHRVEVIRNYVASADWVVAIFPRLFELTKELIGFRALGFDDLGTGGYNGFLDDSANSHEIRYVKGTHSAALEIGQFQSIANFVCRGTDEVERSFLVDKQSGLVTLMSRLCWLVWPALAYTLFFLGSLSVTWAGATLGLPLILAWSIYLVLVIGLLVTI